jgi:hypothetical protein
VHVKDKFDGSEAQRDDRETSEMKEENRRMIKGGRKNIVTYVRFPWLS